MLLYPCLLYRPPIGFRRPVLVACPTIKKAHKEYSISFLYLKQTAQIKTKK